MGQQSSSLVENSFIETREKSFQIPTGKENVLVKRGGGLLHRSPKSVRDFRILRPGELYPLPDKTAKLKFFFYWGDAIYGGNDTISGYSGSVCKESSIGTGCRDNSIPTISSSSSSNTATSSGAPPSSSIGIFGTTVRAVFGGGALLCNGTTGYACSGTKGCSNGENGTTEHSGWSGRNKKNAYHDDNASNRDSNRSSDMSRRIESNLGLLFALCDSQGNQRERLLSCPGFTVRLNPNAGNAGSKSSSQTLQTSKSSMGSSGFLSYFASYLGLTGLPTPGVCREDSLVVWRNQINSDLGIDQDINIADSKDTRDTPTNSKDYSKNTKSFGKLQKKKSRSSNYLGSDGNMSANAVVDLESLNSLPSFIAIIVIGTQPTVARSKIHQFPRMRVGVRLSEQYSFRDILVKSDSTPALDEPIALCILLRDLDGSWALHSLNVPIPQGIPLSQWLTNQVGIDTTTKIPKTIQGMSTTEIPKIQAIQTNILSDSLSYNNKSTNISPNKAVVIGSSSLSSTNAGGSKSTQFDNASNNRNPDCSSNNSSCKDSIGVVAKKSRKKGMRKRINKSDLSSNRHDDAFLKAALDASGSARGGFLSAKEREQKGKKRMQHMMHHHSEGMMHNHSAGSQPSPLISADSLGGGQLFSDNNPLPLNPLQTSLGRGRDKSVLDGNYEAVSHPDCGSNSTASRIKTSGESESTQQVVSTFGSTAFNAALTTLPPGCTPVPSQCYRIGFNNLFEAPKKTEDLLRDDVVFNFLKRKMGHPIGPMQGVNKVVQGNESMSYGVQNRNHDGVEDRYGSHHPQTVDKDIQEENRWEENPCVRDQSLDESYKAEDFNFCDWERHLDSDSKLLPKEWDMMRKSVEGGRTIEVEDVRVEYNKVENHESKQIPQGQAETEENRAQLETTTQESQNSVESRNKVPSKIESSSNEFNQASCKIESSSNTLTKTIPEKKVEVRRTETKVSLLSRMTSSVKKKFKRVKSIDGSKTDAGSKPVDTKPTIDGNGKLFDRKDTPKPYRLPAPQFVSDISGDSQKITTYSRVEGTHQQNAVSQKSESTWNLETSEAYWNLTKNGGKSEENSWDDLNVD